MVSFWHRAYMPSESCWKRTGRTRDYTSTAPGAEGEVASEFIGDVERWINFFRDLCGVPANVSLNTNGTVLIEPGNRYEPAASMRKRDAIQPFRLRFRLYRTDPGGTILDRERFPEYATGAFIDELQLVGCDWLKPGGLIETGPALGVVEFGSSTTTLSIETGQEWALRTRPVMGGHPFP